MIDTHIHFFDPNWPGGLIWPSPESPIYDRHLPQDFLTEADAQAPHAVIAVETSPRAEDDRRLLRLARENGFIKGFIANLQPRESGFEQRVLQFASEPKFKGIRLRPIEAYDLDDPQLRARLAVLSQGDFVLELGTKTLERLRAYTRLAASLPDLPCVLVHGGHLLIDGLSPSAERIEAVRCFADLPNTVCKVTPLVHFASDRPAPWDISYYRSHLDLLWQSFGPQSVMFGGNWPVSKPLGAYGNHVRLFEAYFADRPKDAARFFAENARANYALR